MSDEQQQAGKSPAQVKDHKKQYTEVQLVKEVITSRYYEKFPNSILENPELDIVNKFILFELLKYVRPGNWGIFPNHQSLLKAVGISWATLKRKLDQLKNLEYIKWESGKGIGNSNRYQITPKLLLFHKFSDEQLQDKKVILLLENAEKLRTRGVAQNELPGSSKRPTRGVAQNELVDKTSIKKTFRSKTSRGKDFSNEKSPPQKKVGKILGKDMEEESPLSISKNSEILGATRCANETNVVPIGRAKNQIKGDEGMSGVKYAKGRQANEFREDLTEGLPLSKSKQTGRKPPVKGKTFGQQQRQAKTKPMEVYQIEQYFREKTGTLEEILYQKDQKLVVQLVNNFGIDEIKQAIQFGVDNWQHLKTKFDFMAPNPQLDKLITHWSIEECQKMMKKMNPIKPKATAVVPKAKRIVL